MIDIVKIGLLFDFYETLLTERQSMILEMYLNENLSLSEISDIVKITRQGVHDIITRTASKLVDYENKLMLSGKMIENKQRAEKAIRDIESGNSKAAIQKMREIVEG